MERERGPGDLEADAAGGAGDDEGGPVERGEGEGVLEVARGDALEQELAHDAAPAPPPLDPPQPLLPPPPPHHGGALAAALAGGGGGGGGGGAHFCANRVSASTAPSEAAYD